MFKRDIKKFYINTASVLIVTLFLLSACTATSQDTEDNSIPSGLKVKVEIIEGMTLHQIASVLEEKGVVDNGFMFRLFVQQKGKEKNLSPGTYDMITGSEYEEVLEKLLSGPPQISYRVAIPEGYTANDIIEKFSSEIPFIDFSELENAAVVNNYDYGFLENIDSLEGFLFPKTYELVIEYEATDIIEMMLAQYQYETGDLDYGSAEEKGYTRYDILKIASMIEREAYIPEERELISAVIHNRLDINMTLGIDATLCYYLDKWEEPLTESDLELDTPYNTRKYNGLPPTPICNPGLDSIMASLNPADVDYLYFVVTDTETHKHSFTDNPDEHLNNINNAK